MVLEAEIGISQICPWQISDNDLVSLETTTNKACLQSFSVYALKSYVLTVFGLIQLSTYHVDNLLGGSVNL